MCVVSTVRLFAQNRKPKCATLTCIPRAVELNRTLSHTHTHAHVIHARRFDVNLCRRCWHPNRARFLEINSSNRIMFRVCFLFGSHTQTTFTCDLCECLCVCGAISVRTPVTRSSAMAAMANSSGDTTRLFGLMVLMLGRTAKAQHLSARAPQLGGFSKWKV